MTDKLQQIAKEQILQLPKEVQIAINSLDWGTAAEEIAKKHNLIDSEINDFQVETLLVLIGLEDSDDYVRNIENGVIVSKEEAENMAREANEKIFTPIYDKITEDVKKNLDPKRVKLDQTMDFIMSGGDYTAFVEPIDGNVSEIPKTRPIGTSSTQDMKDKLIN